MKKEKVNINLATITNIIEYAEDLKGFIYESLSNSFSSDELKKNDIMEIYGNMLSYVKNNEAKVYLATMDKLIGFIWFFEIKQQRLHINYFAVSEEYRGLGIGKLLLESVHLFAKENNFRDIELYVSDGNTIAINFYFKYGYEEIDEPNSHRNKLERKINRDND